MQVHNAIFGLAANGQLIGIAQAQRGKACNCTCPACGEPLVAKQGKVVSWHFAHATTKQCAYAAQTGLHLAIKEILVRHKKMLLPPVRISVTNKEVRLGWCGWRQESYGTQALLQFDSVVAEKKYDSFIPDIIAKVGSKTLLIEVFVTHKVSPEKLAAIQASDAAGAIEIDLSQLYLQIKQGLRPAFTMQDLEAILFEQVQYTHWLHSKKALAYGQTLIAEEKARVDKKHALRIAKQKENEDWLVKHQQRQKNKIIYKQRLIDAQKEKDAVTAQVLNEYWRT